MKNYVLYECERCGKSSTDKQMIEKCELSHVNKDGIFPVAAMNNMLCVKQLQSPIKKVYLNPLDGSGELAYFKIEFNDDETYDIYPPFGDNNVEIY